MDEWKSALKGGPADWLPEKEDPSVRCFALQDRQDRREEDSEIQAAKGGIMETGIVPDILAKRKKDKLPYGPQAAFSVFADTMVEMTWQEVQAGADRKAVVLLPIGIVEGHGPHLDLSPDFYLSALYCRFLKQQLEEHGVEALIAPPVYWGISLDVARYAGTFSLRPETMKGLLEDIFLSLKSWGFRRVFAANAHGDPLHVETIKSAISEVNDGPDFIAYFLWDLGTPVEESGVVFPPMREDRYQPDYHAGAVETAQMAAFFPEKVRREVARVLKPQDSFHPLAYCGDPAGFEEEYNITEYTAADVALDAVKIQAILRRDGR